MNTPRDRARDRLRRWREEQEFADPSWSVERFRKTKLPRWSQSKGIRLFQNGPRLEWLDEVERATGLLARDLIARQDAEQDAPLNATERELLRWYRAASPDHQRAVMVLLSAHAERTEPHETVAHAESGPCLPDPPVPILRDSPRRRRRPKGRIE